jgi:hypothetical protein
VERRPGVSSRLFWTQRNAPSQRAGLSKPDRSFSRTSPRKPASPSGITRWEHRKRTTSWKPQARAWPWWISTTTAGSTSIWCTDQRLSRWTAKRSHRMLRCFTTITMELSPTSPAKAGVTNDRWGYAEIRGTNELRSIKIAPLGCCATATATPPSDWSAQSQ